jgi:hypothetical protein
MKAVKAQLPEDRVAAFEKGAQAYVKKIVANFKDYEFVCSSRPTLFPVEFEPGLQYVGASLEANGLVALLNYREDGITREGSPFLVLSTSVDLHPIAYITFWKDGLKEQKL